MGYLISKCLYHKDIPQMCTMIPDKIQNVLLSQKW